LRELTLFFYFPPCRSTCQETFHRWLSVELEVLKAEHDSLQGFLKESTGKETKEKKEREEKHAQAITELNGKLKKSNARIKTLVSKAKTSEKEADDIDKLIFRKDLLLFSGFLHIDSAFYRGGR
jgi:hypothetical protein